VVIDRVAERSKLENLPESRLPKFTLAEKMRIKGTYDFLGINHYITTYTRAVDDLPVNRPSIDIDAGGERFSDPSWEGCGAGWIKVVPWGLRRLLNWIKNTYRNPDIIITESGYADGSEVFEDDGRINYYRVYLNATLQAILEDGVNVKGYMAWSLMDNYEWIFGYTLRFGLYHVNFTDPNRTRTPKKSVEYFKNVIKTRTIN
jgi:beta-glucosidase/6-phospho-beta-glucosidase/beta-galactosidase